MNEHERKALREMFPDAKQAFRLRNTEIFGASDLGETQDAKPERVVRDVSLGAAQRETTDTACFLVSIVAYRKKLLDPDNLCPKYFIDCLRYAGLIPDDRPQDIKLQVGQVQTRGEEGVAVRIEKL